MGNKLSFPLDTLMGCLLTHWKRYQLEGIKRKKLIKYCTQYWPTYSLGGDGKWPHSGSLGFNTILQLSLYCKHENKHKEVPYVQAFMASTRILRKGENVSLKTLINALAKSFWQGPKEKIPLTFS